MRRQSRRDSASPLELGLSFARSEIGRDVTVQRLLILLAAYRHEGVSQRELLAFLDMTSIAALSRNLADLSAMTSRKTPGPGLLEQRIDPGNLRVRRIFLTERGKRVVRRFLELSRPSQGSSADPAPTPLRVAAPGER